MTLRKELTLLAAGGQQLHGDEVVRLSKKYCIDTHEIAFLFDAALAGKLRLVRGLNIDREVDDGE